jgi:hypothetical protein
MRKRLCLAWALVSAGAMVLPRHPRRAGDGKPVQSDAVLALTPASLAICSRCGWARWHGEVDDLVIDGVGQICPTPSQLLVGDLGAYCSRSLCASRACYGVAAILFRSAWTLSRCEMLAADIKPLSNYRRVPRRVRHAIVNPAFSLFCLSP